MAYCQIYEQLPSLLDPVGHCLWRVLLSLSLGHLSQVFLPFSLWIYVLSFHLTAVSEAV